MSIFSSYKKIFLLGFIIIILIAIPFSVYLAQQRQQIKSKAAKSTTISLSPSSQDTTVDKTISFDVLLDPGTGATANQVSFVNLVIDFDPLKFTTIATSIEPNPNSPNTLTSILEGPTYTSGRASIALSIGSDPTNALSKPAKIATLNLKAISATDKDPTSITFNSTTQVLSLAASDQASEDVLSTTTPAKVTIASSSSTTPTPTTTATPSGTLTPTPTPTKTPTPTPGIGEPTGILIGVTETPLDLTPTLSQIIPTQTVLPPTGEAEKVIGIGVIGAILTIIGGALFFIL